MSDIEKKEADLRLLDVLLAEEFGGELATDDDAATPACGQVLDLPVAANVAKRRSIWPAAAALLLGVGVVAFAMAAEHFRAESDATAGQEPKQGPELVKATTVENFLAMLGQTKCLQLVRKETVGAGRVHDNANGSSDRLDTIRWPQVLRIKGEELDRWRKALHASSPQSEKSQHVNEVYDFELELPGNRLFRTFASFAGKETRIWIAENHPMVPNEQLLPLIEKASKQVNERRRLALGKVHDRAELLAMPETATRLEIAVEDLLDASDADIPACFTSIERLTLRGEPTDDVWRLLATLERLRHFELVGATMHDRAVASVAKMTRLHGLALRQCTDFSGDDLGALKALRKLRTLHLIDTSPGGEDLELHELTSLPRLREFGLRASHALADEQLEAIGLTKIERLLLVDLNMQGDLSYLAHLPSLQDLVLVAKVGDQYLQPLSQIESLKLLTVRNAMAGGEFLAAIMAEVPECKIDWTKNARWWQTDYAFRYIERAWPVTR